MEKIMLRKNIENLQLLMLSIQLVSQMLEDAFAM